MKHFREGIERVKLRQETLKKIQESSPDRDDGRTLLVSPIEHQRFYDSYEAFWNSGKGPQSTTLVKTFELSAAAAPDTARLEEYVVENRKITAPEIPAPTLVKNFPFVSQVGQSQELLSPTGQATTKSQR